MKKIFTFTTIIGLLLAVNVVPAFAETPIENKIKLPRITASESGEKIGEQIKETVANKVLENLKKRANEEINRRITSLTKLINKISEIKRLTESQKASLTSSLQAEIDSLKLLNTKIQSDTDIATLRKDVKSIVDSYRIYLLVMPQTQIIIAADKLLNTADILTQFAAKLQTRISETKNAGKDTTVLEATLADMMAKIADAKTQANNAINEVSTLQPTGYPENKTSLQDARTMLQAALKDLIIARQDAQKIVVALRKPNKDITGSPDINITLKPDKHLTGSPTLKTPEISPTHVPGTTSNAQPAE